MVGGKDLFAAITVTRSDIFPGTVRILGGCGVDIVEQLATLLKTART